MLSILFPALLLAPSPSTAAASPEASPKCLNTKLHQAARIPKAKGGKLGDQPAGDLHLTVVRKVGNCQIPTIVAYGFGNGMQARPAR